MKAIELKNPSVVVLSKKGARVAQDGSTLIDAVNSHTLDIVRFVLDYSYDANGAQRLQKIPIGLDNIVPLNVSI